MLIQEFKLSFLKRLQLRLRYRSEYRVFGKDTFYKIWTWCIYLRRNGLPATYISWNMPVSGIHNSCDVIVQIHKDKPLFLLSSTSTFFQFQGTLKTVKMVDGKIYAIK